MLQNAAMRHHKLQLLGHTSPNKIIVFFDTNDGSSTRLDLHRNGTSARQNAEKRTSNQKRGLHDNLSRPRVQKKMINEKRLEKSTRPIISVSLPPRTRKALDSSNETIQNIH